MKIVHGKIAVIEGDTHISRWVEESGRLDHDQYALPLILEHIKAGDTVVDVGAFIGDHTVAYLDKVGKHGRVYAVEPNKAAFDCLKHNCPKAIALNLGLSDKEELLSYEASPNAGAGRIRKGGESEIKTVTLDSLAIDDASFIKIDAEGFELSILKGAVNTIKKSKPTMWIEINVEALRANGVAVSEVENLLLELGYSMKPFPEKGAQYDILCTITKN